MRRRAPRTDWSWLPSEATPGRLGAYVARDGADVVLYVGRTSDLRRRFAKGHRYTAAWFNRAVAVEFVPCSGAAEARVLEKQLIARHRPAANVNDVCPPQRVSRFLPADIVAELVALHEACADAPFRHHGVEAEALDDYLRALHREGWSMAALGNALHMTRQGIHIRLLRANRRAAKRAAA